MKVICELQSIKKAVSTLARLTTKKEQSEVLACLFFLVKENTLVIRATNLSIGAEYTIGTESQNNEDSFVLNAQLIQNIFNSLSVDKNTKNIEITIEENTVLFKYKKNKLSIKKQAILDIPTLPNIQDQSFVIDKKTLKEGISAVVSTSSKSDIKPELASIFINQQEGKLVFATTDTFRLSEYSIKTKTDFSFPSILIPAKNAQEIQRILEDSISDEVLVYPTKNQITFTTKDIFITSQLINGVFPDYTKIIPTLKHSISMFLKTDMLEVLKSIGPFVDIRNQVKMKIDSESKEIEFTCRNDILGEYQGSLPANITGDSFEILVNKGFLEDILMKMDESVTMIINQPQKPILIQNTNKNEILCLLMPMSQ